MRLSNLAIVCFEQLTFSVNAVSENSLSLNSSRMNNFRSFSSGLAS